MLRLNSTGFRVLSEPHRSPVFASAFAFTRALVFAFGAGSGVVSLSCSDPAVDRAAPVQLGSEGGKRVREIRDPAAATPSGTRVSIPQAVVIALDRFDETHNGKSIGTTFIQDVASDQPYSGISIYQASLIPTDLVLAAGDVVSIDGPYQELPGIGTVTFQQGPLPQLDQPIATFRFEYSVPKPVVIDPHDLESYEKGKKWIGMLVAVENIKLDQEDGHSTGGRYGVKLTNTTSDSAPIVSNELCDTQAAGVAAEASFRSIVGVVTYFINFRIAPRSSSDLVK